MFNKIKADAVALKERAATLKGKYEFKAINLKLYDVSYELYKMEGAGKITDAQAVYVFNNFCNDQFNWWHDEFKSLGFTTNHIGRTSSFYIEFDDGRKNGIIEPFQDSGINYSEYDVLYNIYEHYHGGYIHEDIIELLADDKINTESELYNYNDMQYYHGDDLIDMLHDISEFMDDMHRFINDTEKLLKAIEIEYKQISDFKANQVKIFNDWFEHMEEMEAI